MHLGATFACGRDHRADKGRGEKEGISLPSQLERTPQLLMVTLSPPVAVSKQIFSHGNKNSSLVLAYSALFNNAFKALNLFSNKYVT